MAKKIAFDVPAEAAIASVLDQHEAAASTLLDKVLLLLLAPVLILLTVFVIFIALLAVAGQTFFNLFSKRPQVFRKF